MFKCPSCTQKCPLKVIKSHQNPKDMEIKKQGFLHVQVAHMTQGRSSILWSLFLVLLVKVRCCYPRVILSFHPWLYTSLGCLLERQVLWWKLEMGKKKKKKAMIRLETISLNSFKRVEEVSLSFPCRERQHIQQRAIAWAPNIFTEMNHPIFGLLPGGFSEDSLSHSSRGA